MHIRWARLFLSLFRYYQWSLISLRSFHSKFCYVSLAVYTQEIDISAAIFLGQHWVQLIGGREVRWVADKVWQIVPSQDWNLCLACPSRVKLWWMTTSAVVMLLYCHVWCWLILFSNFSLLVCYKKRRFSYGYEEKLTSDVKVSWTNTVF